MSKTIMSLKGISKAFPGVVALDNVSIDFREGEVHALVGENGAGKSTLIKIISGAHEPDSGTIEINGKIYTRMQPKQAMDDGIQVIYQEFNLIPTLSIAENVFLGSYIVNGIIVDIKAMAQKTSELFKKLNVNLDPLQKVKTLSTAHQQIVEITKALSKKATVLIMDEPSAPLTSVEVETMFEMIKLLKEQSVTIIYISHRLEELFQIADRVTVLRDGKFIETKNIKDVDKKQLIASMVGRKLCETYPCRNCVKQDVALEVRNVCGAINKDISFKTYKGEILGIGGLVGSGRTELMRLIFGADPLDSGEILIEGKPVHIKTPKHAISQGIGLIPEDRKQHGVILNMPLDMNITLANLRAVSRRGIIDNKKEKDVSEDYCGRLKVKTPSIKQRAKNLSGGNQQKIVLSKWLATNSKVLIFDEPTRGIDVGAKQEIYQLMCQLAEEGICIIMVSSDMEELLGMSDRIIVLHEGVITGEILKSEFTQEAVLEYASGMQQEV